VAQRRFWSAIFTNSPTVLIQANEKQVAKQRRRRCLSLDADIPGKQGRCHIADLQLHDLAGLATTEATRYLHELFGAPRSQGITMAVAALQGAIPEARVRLVAAEWTRAVLSTLAE